MGIMEKKMEITISGLRVRKPDIQTHCSGPGGLVS